MNARSILPRCNDQSTADNIRRAVSNSWGVTRRELYGRSRKQPTAFARQVAMAMTYELTNMSLDDVGEIYGGRDHTTVIYAGKVVKDAQGNPKVVKEIKSIKEQVAKMEETLKQEA